MIAGSLITIREGLEAFLIVGLLPGAALGLALAAGITYLIFRSAIRLNLRAFFIVTGSLLIVIAAGLIGHSVMALQEIGWLPLGAATMWDMGQVIPNDGLLGRLLHAFIGYEAAPSALMVAAYAAYVLIFGGQFVQAVRGGIPRRDLQAG